MSNAKRRSGLILLVVLGMLSLFSMLAITYVVFSSQSRSSSLTIARKEFRGTPPSRLMDEAAHQLLRGSSDVHCGEPGRHASTTTASMTEREHPSPGVAKCSRQAADAARRLGSVLMVRSGHRTGW